MHAILESIQNRDLALGFWLIVFLAWILYKPEIRRSLTGVMQALAQRQILVAFSLAAATTSLLSYCLSTFNLWTLSQLKGSVFWFVAACIPSIMDVPKLSHDFSLFRKAALKNFELSVLADFYINLFPAPLLVELLFLPIAATLTAMIVIAERREDLKSAHSVLTWIMALIGFCWIAFQTFKLFNSFNQVRTLDTLRDFILPIALNLAFLPFLLLYAAYAAYDSVFASVQFVIKPQSLHRYTKIVLVVRCGLNYMRINRWLKSAWQLNLDSRKKIWQSIGEA